MISGQFHCLNASKMSEYMHLHYENVSVLINFSQKAGVFTLIIMNSLLNHVLDVY